MESAPAASSPCSSNTQVCETPPGAMSGAHGHPSDSAATEVSGSHHMRLLTILCLLLVAAKFGTSLAHVAELPGKLRLDEATYRAVQTISYPRFTLAGLLGEFGGMIALVVLLAVTPYGTNRFWWTAAALACLLAGHATYWLMTHPVNSVWVKDLDMSATGSTFFSTSADTKAADWKTLRNRWELSHAIIAGLVTLSLISIAAATSLLETT